MLSYIKVQKKTCFLKDEGWMIGNVLSVEEIYTILTMFILMGIIQKPSPRI
jgi:hypothetical protein